MTEVLNHLQLIEGFDDPSRRAWRQDQFQPLIDGITGEIGRVVSSEKEPAGAHEFYFWAADDALTLDVGHAHLTEDSAEETVRRYAARLANVHLEGMRRPVHDHLVPWEGDLDLGRVVAALGEVGYAGPATFELSRHSHAAVDTARRAIEFIRAL